MKTKKIMILGGGTGQLPLIKAAKKEKYEVVLCDVSPEAIGVKFSDSFYQINTIDKTRVIEAARKENIDGIISNSEPAMICVSAVVDELGLTGNSSKSVQLLQSKYAFRKFQKDIGAFCPESIESDDVTKLKSGISNLKIPIIIKPSESSGSRGITILKEYSEDIFERAFLECQNFSRNKYVTVEEYIPQNSLLTVGGDIFIHHGKIVWNGLASCIRYPVRKEIPGGKIWPIVETEERLRQVKQNLEYILKKAGVTYGALNIEGYFYLDKFFVIEINVRQGGNAIPQLIYEHSGIDMYRLLVTTCVGDDYYFDEVLTRSHFSKFITNYVVFAEETGNYSSVEIGEDLSKYVYRVVDNCLPGEKVKRGANAGDAVAMVRMMFPSRKVQLDNILNLPEQIKVKLQ